MLSILAPSAGQKPSRTTSHCGAQAPFSRQVSFDQYVNLRPVLVSRRSCPLAGKSRRDIDFHVVRRIMKGNTPRLGGRAGTPGPNMRWRIQESVIRRGVDRILRWLPLSWRKAARVRP